MEKKVNILVTGTPCVGKTTFSQLLQDKLKEEHIGTFHYINLSTLIVEKQLYKKWNKEFDVPEFDEDMVCDELESVMQQGGVILEFHSCSFFPERWFQLIVLLRATNTQLYDRQTARGYKENKITENIQCEIMEVTSEAVYESYKPEIIMELQSNTVEDMEKNIDAVVERLQGFSAESMTN
eukprot:TRINITY_DN12511_c0_g1_i2.p1 TRINITY_DN12511_c0_g1~~TRINITY_DN12511_c0_g1_i2.p1  ORF type:complete len:181 (+),score=58.51 TRINITY_DN12511_c0_g1_i2:97-639(+)